MVIHIINQEAHMFVAVFYPAGFTCWQWEVLAITVLVIIIMLEELAWMLLQSLL